MLFQSPRVALSGGIAVFIGHWHTEKLDLQNLSETQWGDADGARLIELALFCDTDAAGTASIADLSAICTAASN